MKKYLLVMICLISIMFIDTMVVHATSPLPPYAIEYLPLEDEYSIDNVELKLKLGLWDQEYSPELSTDEWNISVVLWVKEGDYNYLLNELTIIREIENYDDEKYSFERAKGTLSCIFTSNFTSKKIEKINNEENVKIPQEIFTQNQGTFVVGFAYLGEDIRTNELTIMGHCYLKFSYQVEEQKVVLCAN